MANKLSVQIGLIPLIARPTNNAVLIVGQARVQHASGCGLSEAAVQAARVRMPAPENPWV